MRWLISLPFLLTLSCSRPVNLEAKNDRQANPPSPITFSKNTARQTVGADWKPGDIQISCGEGRCLPQVGVLFFFESQDQDRIQLRRCTASLIAEDLILTAAHCTGKSGYFLIGAGAAMQVAAIDDIVFKEFVKTEPTEIPKADVAILRLRTKITGIDPLRLAKGSTPAFKELRAYVVNPVAENFDPRSPKYKIDEKICRAHRHESLFPYEFSENPSLLIGFDCVLQPGNSGSPVLTVGSSEIQGLMQDITSPDVSPDLILSADQRKLLAFERRPLAWIANIRCLKFEGRGLDCLNMTWAENHRRFTGLWSKMQNQFPVKSDLDFRFSPYPFTFAKDKQFEFDVFYSPDCLLSTSFSEVRFFSDHVIMDFDEWARPSFRLLESRVSRGAVQSVTGASYKLNVSWAPEYELVKNAEDYPRQKWGSRFSIEIPQCAR